VHKEIVRLLETHFKQYPHEIKIAHMDRQAFSSSFFESKNPPIVVQFHHFVARIPKAISNQLNIYKKPRKLNIA